MPAALARSDAENAEEARRCASIHPRRDRKDRIPDGREGVPQERGADRLRRLPRVELERFAPESRREQAGRQEVAAEVEDVVDVVGAPDPPDRVGDDGARVLGAQRARAADADALADVLRERRQDDPLLGERLEDQVLGPQRCAGARDTLLLRGRADEERRVRPGGGRQVRDDLRDPLVSLDQEDVSGPENGREEPRIPGRHERIGDPGAGQNVHRPPGQAAGTHPGPHYLRLDGVP